MFKESSLGKHGLEAFMPSSLVVASSQKGLKQFFWTVIA